MKYQQAIDFLFNQLPVYQNKGAGAYKPGLANALSLVNAFGNPHSRLKCVHVAGTNGKGSTSHTIASVLMAQGYKVGLYTSPHLVDFRERIKVNGDMISEEAVVDFVERYKAMNLGLEPSFFELTTIMAFEHFANSAVDFAVIEVGLGGRLDTTNIITPILSIITNVSLEHTALLGNSIEQIAREKGGIIKPGVPVVIGEAALAERAVFEEIAKRQNAPIVFAQDTPVACVADGMAYTYGRRQGMPASIHSDLCGDFQPKNANTALHAFDYLPVSDEAVAHGMANVAASTGLIGRWSVASVNPTVVYDSGHNPGAWRYLAPRLAEIASRQCAHIVLGFSNDKDVNEIFKSLPKQASYYFVTPSVERGRPASELKEIADQFGLRSSAFASVDEGYRQALAKASADAFVFVGGSFFVISDMLKTQQ